MLRDLFLRLFNLAAAGLGLLLLSPLFLYIAWRLKRDTPGPVFYRGARLGRGGVPFHILKFRTMYAEPASDRGPRITAGDDPRITPFGRLLRDTKRNSAPAVERLQRRDEPGRPAPRRPGRRR